MGNLLIWLLKSPPIIKMTVGPLLFSITYN